MKGTKHHTPNKVTNKYSAKCLLFALFTALSYSDQGEKLSKQARWCIDLQHWLLIRHLYDGKGMRFNEEARDATSQFCQKLHCTN